MGDDNKDKKTSLEVVPAFFLTAHTPDDFVLEVEGRELHVSKGVLASRSPVLSAMAFNEGFPEARKGSSDLKTKTLSEVVAYLCWQYGEDDPRAPEKTYGKEGEKKRIAVEDLSDLLVLADEWQVARLKTECRVVFDDFVENNVVKGLKAPIRTAALNALEWLCLNDEELKAVVDKFANTGVAATDFCTMDVSDAFRCRIYEVVFRRVEEQMRAVPVCFHCGTVRCIHGANIKTCYQGTNCYNSIIQKVCTCTANA